MSILSKIYEIVAPSMCYWCKKRWNLLCNSCFLELNNYTWFCYICKRLSKNFKIHKHCLIENKLLNWKNFNNKKIYVNKIIVLSHYSEKVIKKMITDFKFKRRKQAWKQLSEKLSVLVKKNIDISNRQDYLIIPVPLHWFKKMTRWFNQSKIISEIIWQSLEINYSKNVLHRSKYTRQQSRLSKDKRLENLDNAFKINKKHKENIDKKHILLVDDVVSSGTTLNEIAKILKQNWAASVTWVCLASN